MLGAYLRNQASASPVSSAKIPPSLDKRMDKTLPANGPIQPGISMRNGPVKEDTEMKEVNGTAASAKRKASRPSYAEEESSDDDKPIVRSGFPPCKDLND